MACGSPCNPRRSPGLRVRRRPGGYPDTGIPERAGSRYPHAVRPVVEGGAGRGPEAGFGSACAASFLLRTTRGFRQPGARPRCDERFPDANHRTAARRRRGGPARRRDRDRAGAARRADARCGLVRGRDPLARRPAARRPRGLRARGGLRHHRQHLCLESAHAGAGRARRRVRGRQPARRRGRARGARPGRGRRRGRGRRLHVAHAADAPRPRARAVARPRRGVLLRDGRDPGGGRRRSHRPGDDVESRPRAPRARRRPRHRVAGVGSATAPFAARAGSRSRSSARTSASRTCSAPCRRRRFRSPGSCTPTST